MTDLTILTLCQALANLTNNRCYLVENSNTCRCIGESFHVSKTSIGTNSFAPDIMLSEVFLIFFVLAIWLSAIGFCLNQYKSLRRLETQVHYCVNRKDPLNIGEIKIVTREQDSIIYKKKRYSTLVDTQMTTNDLKTMHYVQQYLPKTMSTDYTSSSNMLLSRHDEEKDEEQQCDLEGDNTSKPYFCTENESIKRNIQMSHIQRTNSARYSTSLTVPLPHMSPSASSHSAWADTSMYETSSTQHLSVPANNLASSCSSSGEISFPVPQYPRRYPPNEQLLDPRLISATVRRSLLALHRESQENVNMLKKKDKTRSETDVHGVFLPFKTKLKTVKQQFRPHSKTLSIIPAEQSSTDHEQQQQQPQPIVSISRPQRSLKHYPKYATQSTPETDTLSNEPILVRTVYASIDDENDTKI